MMSKILLGFKVLSNFLSQIKPDDIPPKVKLDDVNNKWEKPIKVLTCERRFCLNWATCF